MLEYRNVHKAFDVDGGALTVIQNFTASIREAEFVVLVGPSGCGKSTLLRITAGLESFSSGEVRIDGAAPDPRGRGQLGFVFQDAALMPWRDLLSNVTLGLEIQGVPRPTREQRGLELLGLLGLQGFEHYYPHQVSGGMRHRVAIARAYIVDPVILLMDEPFVALDAQTREGLQRDLLDLWQRLKKTVIFVTHNLEEAILLGTRVIVLSRRPASIRLDREVRLPMPRDPTNPDFVALRQELRELLT
ncbi:MAG TPA: ABC transporter ATP-binding protein [Methylomirabilota bacterium]|nr:ABC transporter ATP-binding protein [Methylomirabilota bacterium]